MPDYLVYETTGKEPDVLATFAAKTNRDALLAFMKETGRQGYITQRQHGARYIFESDGGLWIADRV